MMSNSPIPVCVSCQFDVLGDELIRKHSAAQRMWLSGSGRRLAMTRGVESRVGGRDDRTHGLLVEALVALAALEVFQVAADGPVGEEPGVLLGIDPAEGEATVRAELRDGPEFPGGEGLAQEGEVGERWHGLDLGFALKCRSKRV